MAGLYMSALYDTSGLALVDKAASEVKDNVCSRGWMTPNAREPGSEEKRLNVIERSARL